MTSQNKRWYSGHEILMNDIHEVELLDAVKACKLTPYNGKSRKKVIDVKTAERMWICRRTMTDEKIHTVWRYGEYYKEDSEQSLVVDCLADFDIEYNGFFLPEVLDYIYEGDEVRAVFPGRISGDKQAENEGHGNPDQKTLDVSEYIKRRRAESVVNNIIAHELYDKEGRYKLTHLETARALGLDAGLNPGQISAIRKRGKRACDKGKLLLSSEP